MVFYTKDEYDKELLVSPEDEYVMMEWEKPYMEKSIDVLKPHGDVLEIGWGCGYSATQILKYKPRSYTVIECSSSVIIKAKEWAKQFKDTKINIVEGMWQSQLHHLGLFDCIYFDDFPLGITEQTSKIEIHQSNRRFTLFIDLCIQNHTKIGSRICSYLNENPTELTLGSDSTPFVKTETTRIRLDVPDNCKYRNVKEQMCTIPIITKVKDFTPVIPNEILNIIKR